MKFRTVFLVLNNPCLCITLTISRTFLYCAQNIAVLMVTVMSEYFHSLLEKLSCDIMKRCLKSKLVAASANLPSMNVECENILELLLCLNWQQTKMHYPLTRNCRLLLKLTKKAESSPPSHDEVLQMCANIQRSDKLISGMH